MKLLKKLLPHVTIVLSLMTLTFFVINQFNTMMGFMTSRISQWVFALLALAALLTAARLIASDLREARRRRERLARQRREARLQRMLRETAAFDDHAGADVPDAAGREEEADPSPEDGGGEA
jgi:uncharacterized integral membrane protein